MIPKKSLDLVHSAQAIETAYQKDARFQMLMAWSHKAVIKLKCWLHEIISVYMHTYIMLLN